MKTGSLVLSMLVMLAPLAHAADTPPPAADTQPMDQVVVEATRANMQKLGKEILAAEYRYYQRYNELNKKREYAVKCVNEAATGSRFKNTSCQPVYQTEAQEAEAREFLYMLGGGGAPSGGGPARPAGMGAAPFGMGGAGSGGASAKMAIEAGRPDFKKNMQEVTNANPELIKMLQEHAALWKRYDEMYRRLNGAKPRAEDKDVAAAAPAPSADSK